MWLKFPVVLLVKLCTLKVESKVHVSSFLLMIIREWLLAHQLNAEKTITIY